MSRFFINRPIVAIVIAIFFVIAGAVMVFRLPIAQFPEHRSAANSDDGYLYRRRRAHRRSNPSPLRSRSRSTAPRT